MEDLASASTSQPQMINDFEATDPEPYSDSSDTASIGEDTEDFVPVEIVHDVIGNVSIFRGSLEQINYYFSNHASYARQDTFSVAPRNRRFLEYDRASPDLMRNMVFVDKSHLQYCVIHYHVCRKYQFRVRESSPTKWVTVCYKARETGCTWYCRAIKGKRQGSWYISQLQNAHTCPVGDMGEVHCNLSRLFIGNELMDRVRMSADLSVSTVIQHIYTTYNYVIPYKKAWYGIQRAFELVHGTWESSVQKLPGFLTAMTTANPGSPVMFEVLQTDRGPADMMIRYVFWSFKPCIDAYRYCSPVIAVDATHLYARYNHKLMVAVTKDGGGHLLPLGFALVDTESAEAWAWFLNCIDVCIVRHSETCIISYQSTGIKKAVRGMSAFREGRLHHRWCLRHFVSNLNKKFKNTQLKEMAYRAGCMVAVSDFRAEMEKIKQMNEAAYTWLLRKPLQKWSLAHDEDRRCGNMTTNLVECMNHVLKGARRLPITAIAHMSFLKCWEFFCSRRDEINSMTDNIESLTPAALSFYENALQKAMSHQVEFFDHHSLRAIIIIHDASRGREYRRFVDLRRQTCSCGYWTKYRVPCSHALRAAKKNKMTFDALLIKTSTIESLRLAYCSSEFQPIADEEDWTLPRWHLLHDPRRAKTRRAGRPRNTRIRNEMDGLSTQDYLSGSD